MSDDYDDADDMDEGAEEPKGGKHDGLFRRLTGWFRADRTNWQKWRREAQEDFEFFSGEQWSDADRKALEDKARPPIVFNRVAPLVNAVVGAEVNNRREVRYIPREQGDAIPNEMLTSAADWFRDQANGEDEDSSAFQDAVICGLGWTEIRLDLDDNPDGDPWISQIDPFEMLYDHRAVKPNLVDAKRIWRVRDMDCAAAEEMFPSVPKSKLHAGWAMISERSEPHDQDKADLYESEDKPDDGEEKTVRIVECQWIEFEEYVRAADPNFAPDPDKPNAQPTLIDMDKRQFAALLKDFEQKGFVGEYPHTMARRKVVKRVFIGGEILKRTGGDGEDITIDAPMTPKGVFSYQAITGYYCKKRKHFYGLVRGAKDPQRWSNKWLSQVMHILNSQAKGGIIAEEDAFTDQRAAEATYAHPDAITFVRKGTIQNSKIMPKPAPQLPVGFMQLMQESKQAISDVTGLSPEFLGTREANQPGVLEYQRRQSSLNLLASLFDSLRRYRKQQGRILLYLIQNHLADGRLVKVVGKDREQYVPLMKETVSTAEFDVVVDDAPNSPNEKEKTWQIMTTLLPMVKDYLTPDIGMEILRYSPLPPSMVEKLAQAVKAEQEKSAPEQDQAKQAAMANAEVEMQAKAAKADLDDARAEEIRIKNAAEMLALQYGIGPRNRDVPDDAQPA
jgi:hypothetical protein